MPESAQSMLERFQLVRVPSLPHLFLQTESRPDRAPGQEGLPDDDPFLCLRLLGSCQGGLAGGEADDGGRKLPPALYDALVSSAALHTLFAEPGDLQLNFYKQHWRKAVLCSALMRELARLASYPRERQAALCGLLLDCGEIVLENLWSGQYLDLHRQASSERELFDLERGNFGVSHAELGAGLLEGWRIDRGMADALRYHHEPVEAMDDAGKLSRLAWLASVIAAGDTPRDSVAALAARLLRLDGGQIDGAIERARATLAQKEKDLRLESTDARRLPLDPSRPEAVAAQDEVARLQLRQRVMGMTLFNAVRPAIGASRDQLSQAVGGYLSLLFGLKAFALFQYSQSGHCLRAVAGQPGWKGLAEFEIHCGERSGNARQCAVLACYRSRERHRLEEDGADEQSLTVLDRQLLALLGTRNLFCDPVMIGGRTAAVLVIGYNAGAIDYYTEQSLITPLFKQALAGLLAGAGESRAPAAKLLHEQKVREVIHEVNNPLGIIKNYLELLALRQQDSPQVSEEIGVLKAEIDRIAAILHGLREDAQADEFTSVDLNEVIGKLARVFNSSFIKEKQLSLSLDLDPALAPVQSSENALKQVITNLVVNAMEALPAQGDISIRTRGDIYADGCRLVEMTIRDNGPGMAPEVMERLFTRANSTKGMGHAGDGLAIVKSLSDRLGGRLSCRTGKQGTEFSLLLPQTVVRERT